jgi:hypothetical protein
MFNLLTEATRIEGDINESLQSVRLSDSFTNECLIDAEGQISNILDHVSSIENLVLIASKMINDEDEAFVSTITKKYFTIVLRYVPTRRRSLISYSADVLDRHWLSRKARLFLTYFTK